MRIIANPFKTTRRPKEKRSTPTSLPNGWFNMAYSGHSIIMNHRPVWSRKAAKLMEDRLHEILADKIATEKYLPQREEIKNYLREDGIRDTVNTLFKNNLGREVHDVDFELGIVYACRFIADPLPIDIGILPEKVEQGLVSSGEIIEKFYTIDNA